MMNLIPPDERELLVRDFSFRSYALFFGALGSALTIAAVLAVPRYMSYAREIAWHEEQLVLIRARNAESASSEIEKVAEVVNRRVQIAQDSFKKEPAHASVVLRRVLAQKPGTISLESLAYGRIVKEGAPGIRLGGSAATREALLAFIAKLSADGAFARVDAPISLFAVKADLPFAVTADVVLMQQ